MSKRIEEIGKLIHPYKTVADVGCDHGYLLIEAFNQGITFAQAIDNKQGPLNAAKQNLKEYGEKIIFSLSDGISDLDPMIEVVVLAGMGGSLVYKILTSQINKLEKVKRIIIQANRNIEKVRKFALEHSFKVVFEKVIEEESIIYEIIVLEKGYQLLDESEMIFGPCLLKEKNEIFIRKWKNIYNHYQTLNRNEHKKIMKLIEDNILKK